MTRYRLPEALGGGEHEAAAFYGGDSVGFDLPGVRDRLWLCMGDLTEVVPHPLAGAPHLPFTARGETPNCDFRVGEPDDDGHIPVMLIGWATGYLTAANARLAGLALLKAAQQQEGPR